METEMEKQGSKSSYIIVGGLAVICMALGLAILVLRHQTDQYNTQAQYFADVNNTSPKNLPRGANVLVNPGETKRVVLRCPATHTIDVASAVLMAEGKSGVCTPNIITPSSSTNNRKEPSTEYNANAVFVMSKEIAKACPVNESVCSVDVRYKDGLCKGDEDASAPQQFISTYTCIPKTASSPSSSTSRSKPPPPREKPSRKPDEKPARNPPKKPKK